MLQYLLQQNRSITGKDKVATGASECKQYCDMPLLTDLVLMMQIDPLALVHGLREFVTVMYGPVMSFVFPDVQVKAYMNSVVCQLSLGFGLFRAEFGGTEGAEGVGQ